MVKINNEITYIRGDVGNNPHNGYYIDGYLKENLDNYFIAAVDNKLDAIMAVTGLEGSGKSTIASTMAVYCDPTFPGEPLNDGTPRRKCTRIVFTPKQIIEAIDGASKKQAIVIDEAILALFSQDYSSEIQKVLIKKFVTIRKKRLFIFIVIPSIFMLRKYFAIFRTRCCVHTRLDDGIHRGNFNFYSFNTKRNLWIRGIKEFDQSIVPCDFSAAFTDTYGFFFDPDEYEQKKDEAIAQITAEPEEKKQEMSATRKRIMGQRDILLDYLYDNFRMVHQNNSQRDFCNWLNKEFCFKITDTMVCEALHNSNKIKEDPERKILHT